MNRWSELFQQVDALDLSGRRFRAEGAEFEAWCQTAERALLAELGDLAESRATELALRTEVQVLVSRAVQGPALSDQGPRASAVELRLGETRVYLYSARELGESPAVHLAVRRGGASTRCPVLASLPGALVVRGEGGSPRLLSLPRPLDAPPSEAHPSPDDLVLRAFEVLIAAHRGTSVDAHAAGLPRASGAHAEAAS